MVASSAARKEIAPSERVLWSARALGGLRIDRSALFQSAFGFVFLTFSVIWLSAALRSPPKDAEMSALTLVIGVPFILVGLHMLVGQYLWSALLRRSTEYVLTDQRVIVTSGIFGKTTKSIAYRKFPTLTLTERSDRSGTIQFGETRIDNSGDGVSYAATKIDAVPDVRLVYNLIREASGPN